MKKYLMSGVAAIAFLAAFTSCSKSTDLYEEGRKEKDQQAQNEQKVVKSYEDAFEAAFGKPAEDQDWGLSKYGIPNNAGNAGTRSITINSDVYDVFTIPSKADRDAMFPSATDIPESALEVADLTGNLYFVYKDNNTGRNYKITKEGEVEIGGAWNNDNDKAKANNVYVNVDGNVKIIRKGSEYINLYIIKGNVTLDSNYGECGGIISIANGATFNDPRYSHAHNGGVEVYNRGTYNATSSQGFDVGNNCTVYNEGIFQVTNDLHYTAGQGNTPIFYNIGDDSELSAASMTMNSTCHFFNEGTVDIEGLTKVTQQGIYWVNNGHYTTGTMEFSAKNRSFYNYCNLIVEGLAKMYCGQFSLMDNSYTEVGSANLGQENFRINMGNNAGFNAKGNVVFENNADNTEQGFFASGSKAYVRIDGKAQVQDHKYIFVLDGNITYGIKEGIDYLKGLNDYYKPYCEFREGTIEVKPEDFSKFTATPKTNGCGATWKIPGRKYTNRIMGEDLTAEASNDFDFNDVVFDWAISADKKTAYIKLLAAGGTRPLKIGAAKGEGEEVHDLFGVGVKTMVNTGLNGGGITKEPVEFEITTNGTFETAADIIVSVEKGDAGAGWTQMTADKGKAASLLFIPLNTKWVDEYVDIENAFPGFSNWVTTNVEPDWANPVEKYVDLNLSNND
jgi:hypothetical protein